MFRNQNVIDLQRVEWAPDEFQKLCRRVDAAQSINTTLGLAPPKNQGSFLELAGSESAVGATLQLSGCEKESPLVNEKFWNLSEASGIGAVWSGRRRGNTSCSRSGVLG